MLVDEDAEVIGEDGPAHADGLHVVGFDGVGQLGGTLGEDLGRSIAKLAVMHAKGDVGACVSVRYEAAAGRPNGGIVIPS